ncbi:uncharacterized protein LOC124459767 [Drosophila willistoni]|uniref:uncharacterized protein LOC124459767 n=1 Tax=Drosophila willistoni TaxID=7260 RepID=UPI001F07E82C|nr:uncharacterized protein LOC124459767 [Drosophila willistoni]
MNWQLALLYGVFLYFLLNIIDAKCVGRRSGTAQHIWRQLKQPLSTETSSCHRLQMIGSDNATDAVINGTANKQPSVMTLANYVYQCGKRQENDCNDAKEIKSLDEDEQHMAIIKTIDMDMT